MITKQSAAVLCALQKHVHMTASAIQKEVGDTVPKTTRAKLERLENSGFVLKNKVGIKSDRAIYSITPMGVGEITRYLKLYDKPEVIDPKKYPKYEKEKYVKVEYAENVALPRQIGKMSGLYVPEVAVYRNDGHKHLKSRGF